MNKKEFALSQIAPYYHNNKLCAMEGPNCRYRTKDNRMCVFGKNLLEYKEVYEGKNADHLLDEYGEEILKPEARNILTGKEWKHLQVIHDTIAHEYTEALTILITKLNLFTLEELKNYK